MEAALAVSVQRRTLRRSYPYYSPRAIRSPVPTHASASLVCDSTRTVCSHSPNAPPSWPRWSVCTPELRRRTTTRVSALCGTAHSSVSPRTATGTVAASAGWRWAPRPWRWTLWPARATPPGHCSHITSGFWMSVGYVPPACGTMLLAARATISSPLRAISDIL